MEHRTVYSRFTAESKRTSIFINILVLLQPMLPRFYYYSPRLALRIYAWLQSKLLVLMDNPNPTAVLISEPRRPAS